jgi:hypothetical protein
MVDNQSELAEKPPVIIVGYYRPNREYLRSQYRQVKSIGKTKEIQKQWGFMAPLLYGIQFLLHKRNSL